jgi:hypothetical protein
MDASFIKRKPDTYPGMDFFSLRNSAIEYIQQLAGDEWTDYNEHDPGVTILEQLCYAITDLSYRTGFDIQDLLEGDARFRGEGNDTLFPPEEVMHCHPLSLTDWRKVIIGNVENVNNAWVEIPEPEPGVVPGLYRIAVEANTEEINSPELREEMRLRVKEVFHAHRNLCEDIDRVDVLEPRKIRVHANIEIDDYINTEETLAAVFFKLQQLLSRPVRMYTLRQMLDKGYTIDQIFDGPRLRFGFIDEQEMYPRITHLHYARLIRAIQEVPGVKHVSRFSIDGGDAGAGVFRLMENELPQLDVTLNENGNFGIELFKSRIPVLTDANAVQSIYAVLLLSQPKPYVPGQHEQVLKEFAAKRGRERNVNTYRSIQYDFPPIYGIGAYGVGNDLPSPVHEGKFSERYFNTSEQRRALAKQLKGYLRIFEQLLANQLQQLAAVPELFSLHLDSWRSYFPALGLEIPGKEEIEYNPNALRSNAAPGHASDAAELQSDRDLIHQSGAMQRQKSSPATHHATGDFNAMSFEDALDLIMQQNDPFFDRRNTIFDHLLARFGVAIPASLYQDVNWYFTDENEFKELVLLSKAAALRAVPYLTGSRGQAANLLQPKSVSLFERIVQLRFGMLNSNNRYPSRIRPLAWLLFKYGVVNQVNENAGFISRNEIQKMNFTRYDSPVSPEIYDRHLRKGFFDEMKQKNLIPDLSMFHNGYIANNYSLGSESENSKEVTVVYRDPDWHDLHWKRIGRFANKADAVDAILDLCALVRRLNVDSEGMHVIEHVALRPDKSEITCEVKLISLSGKEIMFSHLPFDDEQEAVLLGRDMLISGCSPENYSVVFDASRRIYVFQLSSEGQIIAESVLKFSTEAEAYRGIANSVHECIQLSAMPDVEGRCIIHEIRTRFGKLPPLTFFAFRISVLLPGWTSRFGNRNFRSMMSMLLRNNAPAHTSIDEYWLGAVRMNEIEKVFIDWREARAEAGRLTNAEHADERAAQLAHQLVNMLYELSENAPDNE